MIEELDKILIWQIGDTYSLGFHSSRVYVLEFLIRNQISSSSINGGIKKTLNKINRAFYFKIFRRNICRCLHVCLE